MPVNNYDSGGLRLQVKMLFCYNCTIYLLKLPPSKHHTLPQCWLDVGPSSSPSGQHWAIIGWMSVVAGLTEDCLVPAAVSTVNGAGREGMHSKPSPATCRTTKDQSNWVWDASAFPANTKHLYNFCTMLGQRRRIFFFAGLERPRRH